MKIQQLLEFDTPQYSRLVQTDHIRNGVEKKINFLMDFYRTKNLDALTKLETDSMFVSQMVKHVKEYVQEHPNESKLAYLFLKVFNDAFVEKLGQFTPDET